MKYCLNARQSIEYLNKTNEILVEARDYRYISELFIKYPNTMIILDVTPEVENDEKFQLTIIEYAKCSNNFCCRINNLSKINEYKKNNIKFFYKFPVTTWYEVRGLIAAGVEYINIAAPLTFEINLLKKINMKFRMTPNVCYDNYIPRVSGLYGQWVRPEDTKYYEKGIYVFDFEDADLAKERALFDLYADKKLYDGNLNILFTNFNLNVDNRGIIEDIGKYRANCGQKCMSNGNCHYCDQIIILEKNLRQKVKELQK